MGLFSLAKNIKYQAKSYYSIFPAFFHYLPHFHATVSLRYELTEDVDHILATLPITTMYQ